MAPIVEVNPGVNAYGPFAVRQAAFPKHGRHRSTTPRSAKAVRHPQLQDDSLASAPGRANTEAVRPPTRPVWLPVGPARALWARRRGHPNEACILSVLLMFEGEVISDSHQEVIGTAVGSSNLHRCAMHDYLSLL